MLITTIQRRCGVLGFITLLLLWTVIPVHGAVLSYQGVLRTASGPAVADGAYDMTFSMWDAPTGGTELWAETHDDVSLADGLFSLPLGVNTPLGSLFADHGALWLQIAVDTGAGLETHDPRIPLTAAPFAKRAFSADTADTAVTATHATAANHAATADSATTATSATTVTTAASANNTSNLGGQPPAAYAAATHTHDASHFTSGTLHTDRFSAYADLVGESKIGAGAAQVAAGNHRHSSLPYWTGTVGTETSGTKSLFVRNADQITTVASGAGHALVAPVAGRYLVHFQQLTQSANATYLSMRHNGWVVGQSWINSGVSNKDMIVTRVVNMNAGDTIAFTVDIQVQNHSWGGEHSNVSMYLIGQP